MKMKKPATILQIKARHNNWKIVRLKGARSIFGSLHYNHEEGDIWRLALRGIRICDELQVKLKELYWKEKEKMLGGSDGSVE